MSSKIACSAETHGRRTRVTMSWPVLRSGKIWAFGQELSTLTVVRELQHLKTFQTCQDVKNLGVGAEHCMDKSIALYSDIML